MGIVALSGGGSINVTSSGPITTHGSGAVGIFADSTNLVARSPSEFRPTPVFTATPTGTVQVNATNILTTGQFSTGIVAKGARDVTVNIASGGSVMGGWQAGLTGGSSLFGLPAAGVILNSTGGAATLTNDGSDRCTVRSRRLWRSAVINNGTITGFVQFTAGGNAYFNNGTVRPAPLRRHQWRRHARHDSGRVVRSRRRPKQRLHQQRNAGVPGR